MTQPTEEDFILAIKKLILENGWAEKTIISHATSQPLQVFQKDIADFMRGSQSQVHFSDYGSYGETRFYDLPGQEITLKYPVRNGMWFPGWAYTWKFNFKHIRFVFFRDSGSRSGDRIEKEFDTYGDFYEHITQTIVKPITDVVVKFVLRTN